MPHPLPSHVNCAIGLTAGATLVLFLNQILSAIVWVAEVVW